MMNVSLTAVRARELFPRLSPSPALLLPGQLRFYLSVVFLGGDKQKSCHHLWFPGSLFAHLLLGPRGAPDVCDISPPLDGENWRTRTVFFVAAGASHVRMKSAPVNRGASRFLLFLMPLF